MVSRGGGPCSTSTEPISSGTSSSPDRAASVRSNPASCRSGVGDAVSGQTKTPTLVWNGEVLANFGSDELADFLAARGQITVRPLA